MAWEKPSQAMIDLLTPRALARGCDERKMFGCPAFFVNDNMTAGVHQRNIIMRLSEGDRAEFLETYDARLFEPFEGKPMREYVAVPPSVAEDDALFGGWLDRSIAYTTTVPPRRKRKK